MGGCTDTSPPATERGAGARPAIVSLNPCSDAILVEVADREQLLAISHYSRDPRGSSMDLALAESLPVTRGTPEEVLVLEPDLVIGSSFIDPATRGAYDRLGIRLETLGIARDVAESRAQIRRIAALAGHPARGEALIARIDKALALARPPERSPPVDAIVWQSGTLVPGEQSLIVDLLRRTGFANLAGAQGFGQADRVSLEQMVAHPPQVILATGGRAATGEGDRLALAHPVLDHLPGTRRAGLDPRLLFCGGPTIIAAAERLAEIRRDIAP